MISKKKICYWCGNAASSNEHVPPQNLFPNGYRKDLITVGSCKKHNEEFSKLDERLRYQMTLMGDEEIVRKHFETKARPYSFKPVCFDGTLATVTPVRETHT